MDMTFDVVVAGHICLDIIPTVYHPRIEFLPGRLVEVGPVVLSTGGAVSNAGLALDKLAIPTRLMGKIGNDPFGSAVRGIVAGHNGALNAGMRVAKDEPTSYTVIISTPSQDRMFLHCPGCNDTFGADDIDYAMLAGAKLFHFGYPPLMKRMIEAEGAQLVEMMRRAKATGVTTSLDMCMPDPNSLSGRVNWPEILAAALPYVDIFLPSLDETIFMLNPERREEIAGVKPAANPGLLTEISGQLMSMGPALVGLKMGALGFYLRTAPAENWRERGRACPAALQEWIGRELWSPCFRTSVVGTTGSGDATIAGFLAALLRDLPLAQCATIACAVGACNVEAADALGGLRSWDETLTRLAAGWNRASIDVTGRGWKIDSTSGLWFGPCDLG